MYSRKSARPRMDPWGTPELTGYSCGDFPSHPKLPEGVDYWEMKK